MALRKRSNESMQYDLPGVRSRLIHSTAQRHRRRDVEIRTTQAIWALRQLSASRCSAKSCVPTRPVPL
eukprot:4933680-Alexandrium_andersonii.AAC.1